ncbi:MAG: DNA polymerase I [Alphaproteobacteria bacterium]|nr:DNA polymerase I [Alphaproteobacteria bacterium]
MAKSKTAPAVVDKPMRHLFLIDGSGYIFRAYFALPPMNRPDGTPVNAVLGFARMLTQLLEVPEVDHVAVILDAGRTTFRNEIYPEYKAHRPEPPEDLRPQFPLIREAATAFGMPSIELPGFEADDLIATYARLALAAGARCTIVSSDKDLMQLVRPGVELMDPMKQRRIGPAEVIEKFGVPPERVVDVQALAGDSTDNVPGVSGIGLKTAAQLITEYGDLETLLARAGEIKQPKRREALLTNAGLARISRDLVRLRDDVPPPVDPETFDKRRPDPNVLLPWLETQGFNSLIPRFTRELGPATAPVAVGNPAVTSSAEAATTDAAASAETPADTAAFVPASYELIQDLPALEAFVAEATRAGTVAFDCETDALDALGAGLVGVSMALLDGPWGNVDSPRRRAVYVPLAHRAPGGAQGALDLGGGGEAAGDGALLAGQIPIAEAIARLKPLLEDPAVLKVGQNIKYDMAVLRRHGVTIAPVDDTMLISFVLDAGSHGHGMDELSERHLGHSTIKFADVAGSGRNQTSFDRVALERARDYAAEDADVTMQLWKRLKPRLARDRLTTLYETVERPLIPVLADMERAGIKVDVAKLAGLSADFERRLVDLEREAHAIAGREFNVNSPRQLGEILFDEQKLPGGRRNKTGAWSTDASVLDDLAAQGHALPVKVLEYRQLAKLKSTYTDALVREVRPATGRVHTSYHMTGAATGRLASTDPNLQNIPVRTEEGRKIREAFVAEPGHALLSADYSQIELRLLAHVAEIDTLKAAFARGDDIHAITASEMFGVPVKGMDPLVRRRAKAINFGIIYGISAFGLAAQLGIPQPEARDYIAAYFKRYPGIRDYMERTKEFARKNGWVATPFGRRIHLRGINEKNAGMRGFAERAAINAPLQGGAADVIKRAMIRLPGVLAREGLAARMLLQVHDELLFEVPEAELARTAEVARRTMETAATLSVPLTVETGHGATWAAAH